MVFRQSMLKESGKAPLKFLASSEYPGPADYLAAVLKATGRDSQYPCQVELNRTTSGYSIDFTDQRGARPI